MQTCAAVAEIDGIGIGIDGIDIAWIGLYIGNGGGNNGNLLRETKIKSENKHKIPSSLLFFLSRIFFVRTIFCIFVSC